jgi:hypothetical protein
MNREERLAKNEAWEKEQEEKEQRYEKIKESYNKLSMRDRFLFMTVVHFMIENPETEKEKTEC